MDNPSFCPDYYLDSSPESSVSKSKETIAHIHSIDPAGTLIHPILTPRFAPTCSPPALHGLAQLAQSYNPPLHIQTHLSENTGEISLVRELFPQSKDYTSVYDDFGLLTPRTILAHAVASVAVRAGTHRRARRQGIALPRVQLRAGKRALRREEAARGWCGGGPRDGCKRRV